MSDSNTSRPLCVDLDGTLIQTDVLIETFFSLLKQSIFYIFLIPAWLFKGKANLKHQIAERVDLDASLLPYNTEFLRYIKNEKSIGRALTLATATNIKYAKQISSYLNIFDDVIASNESTNMSGRCKRQELVEKYGENGFDYAGNSKADFSIWQHSHMAILVNPELGVRKKAKKELDIEIIFSANQKRVRGFIKAIRLHQWLKNLLIFVPLVLSHQAWSIPLLLQVFIAFLAFGFCASSVYLLNDFLDLTADRKHSTKRYRPLAGGTLSTKSALYSIPLLLIAAFSISLYLPIAYIWVLLFYFFITSAYSFYLKKTMLIDVLVLAGLYTLRIIAGSVTISITPSFWLLSFSMFIFYSLALVKRHAELLSLRSSDNRKPPGRGYQAHDIDSLSQSGITSGMLSVLVLALYVNSPEITIMYTYPQGIWLLCPILLYWINRIWLLANRGEIHEDPVIFAATDSRSHLLGLIGIIVLWLSI